MADMSSISNYGDRTQIFGTGDSKFDVQKLLELELNAIKLRSKRYSDEIDKYTVEKAAWSELNSTITNLQSYGTKLKDLSTAEKSVLSSSEDSISAIAKGNSIEGSYALTVEQLATKHQATSNNLADATTALGKTDTFKIGDKEIKVTADMSLKDVANAINQSGAGVKAVTIGGTLTITSTKEGINGKMTLEDGANGFLKDIGILASDNSIKSEQKAQNAIFTVNGLKFEKETNAVSDVVDGVTFQLKKVTSSPVELNVKNNNEELKKTIKEFVDTYNKTIFKMKQLTGKESPLQGEGVVVKTNSIMSSIFRVKSDNGMYLSQIGITMDKAAVKEGTIMLNEKELDDMLKKDSDAVMNMFTGQNGIGKKLFDGLDAIVGETGSIKSTFKSIDKVIAKDQKIIDDNEKKFEQQKNSLIEKYARYEVQLNMLDEQLEALKTQFDAMNPKGS